MSVTVTRRSVWRRLSKHCTTRPSAVTRKSTSGCAQRKRTARRKRRRVKLKSSKGARSRRKSGRASRKKIQKGRRKRNNRPAPAKKPKRRVPRLRRHSLPSRRLSFRRREAIPASPTAVLEEVTSRSMAVLNCTWRAKRAVAVARNPRRGRSSRHRHHAMASNCRRRQSFARSPFRKPFRCPTSPRKCPLNPQSSSRQ